MQVTEARQLAHQAHFGQRTRHGDLLTEHLEHVAAEVPAEARTIAFLHDVLEHTELTMADLDQRGLTADERAALTLLTREPGESFEVHALRIAYAHGPGSRLARTVKLADLEDHLRSPDVSGAPPYGWARRHVRACRDSDDAVVVHAAPSAA